MISSLIDFRFDLESMLWIISIVNISQKVHTFKMKLACNTHLFPFKKIHHTFFESHKILTEIPSKWIGHVKVKLSRCQSSVVGAAINLAGLSIRAIDQAAAGMPFFESRLGFNSGFTRYCINIFTNVLFRKWYLHVANKICINQNIDYPVSNYCCERMKVSFTHVLKLSSTPSVKSTDLTV